MKTIFFDGYCNLCNGLINFLMKIDRHHVLKFASLQGETAKAQNLNFSETIEPNSVIYLREGIRYEKSNAILMIFADVGGLWAITKVFFIIPVWIRDACYQFIAKNRYRIFGKKETCRLPTVEELEHFLP